jgi:glutamine synthetase
VPATVFASPTINGYRRFRRNSLAPDRVTWGHDHRGVMVRVLGGAGDPATRLENRVGEPAADPYLYIASQLASGLDGVERKLDPGPFTDAPYKTKHTMLPTRLDEAIGKLDKDKFFRAQFGDIFMEYFVALKRAEIDRFERFCSHAGILDPWGAVTEWEQNEYFDFF